MRVDEARVRGSRARRSTERLAPALLAIVVGIGIAAAGALVLLRLNGIQSEEVNAEAAAFLESVAEMADGEPDLLTTSGTYVYQRFRTANLSIGGGDGGRYSAIVPAEREVWTAANGTLAFLQDSGTPRFLGPRDRERWIADGRPALSGVTDSREGVSIGSRPEPIPWDDQEEFERLVSVAAELTDTPDDLAEFNIAIEQLGPWGWEPGLRAAVYRLLAGLPGVEYSGLRVDSAGREGLGVSMTGEFSPGSTMRTTVVIDPDSSALLAIETDVLTPMPEADASPPVRVSDIVFLETRLTSEGPPPP